MEIVTSPSPVFDGWLYHRMFVDGVQVAQCSTNPITLDCVDAITTEGYRRRGHMSALLKHLLSQGEFKYLQVRRDNDPAIKLYTKLGFVPEFVYDSDGHSMVSMIYPGV